MYDSDEVIDGAYLNLNMTSPSIEIARALGELFEYVDTAARSTNSSHADVRLPPEYSEEDVADLASKFKNDPFFELAEYRRN